MRVKISLLPPFNETKILLPIPGDIASVSNLKKYLFKSVSAIGLVASSWKELVLEIEGFELLAGSEVGDVIQEGDVVTVRLAASSSKTILASTRSTTKRASAEMEKHARATSESTVSRKKRKISLIQPVLETKDATNRIQSSFKQVVLPDRLKAVSSEARDGDAKATITSTATHRMMSERRASTSSTSSDLASSSSSSSSSASSSSSSLSSSSSSYSSSSDSSSLGASPESKSTKQLNSPSKATPPAISKSDPFPVILKPRQPSQPPVPPGQGKTETQSRNNRRRIARQMKKLGEQSTDGHLSTVNGDSTKASTVTDLTSTTMEVEAPVLDDDMDISNRNKKKGFLKEMKGIKGVKTVFGHPETTIAGDILLSAGQTALAGSEGIETIPKAMTMRGRDRLHKGAQQNRPRLVPPSELENLPTNVFVTSVEFPWARHAKKAKTMEPEDEEDEEIQAEGSIILPQVELPTTNGHDSVSAVLSETVLAEIEKSFVSLPALTVEYVPSLKAGIRIAWRDLELDQWTFSPVLKLKIAAFKSTAPDGAINVEQLDLEAAEWDGEDAETGDEVPKRVSIPSTELAEYPGRFKIVL